MARADLAVVAKEMMGAVDDEWPLDKLMTTRLAVNLAVPLLPGMGPRLVTEAG
jgi:hypothetical protein